MQVSRSSQLLRTRYSDRVIAAVLYVLSSILGMLELLIVGRIVASWLGADRSRTIVRMLYETTEPVLALVRPWTRRIPGPLDWSPWAAILLIQAARILLSSFF